MENNGSRIMLSIVSPVLLVFVVMLSLAGQAWHRLLCAIMVIIPTIIHYYFFDSETGAVYYGSAMGFSALTIALLQFIKPNGKPSELVVHLQIISYALLMANIAGYFMWYAYISPAWYNGICLFLAVIEAARLLIHTDGDKKDGIDGRYYNFNNNANKRGLGSGS